MDSVCLAPQITPATATQATGHTRSTVTVLVSRGVWTGVGWGGAREPRLGSQLAFDVSLSADPSRCERV